MSDVVESWVQKAMKARGIIACGIRRADRSLVVQSARAEFPDAEMELALRKFYEAIRALQENQFPTERIQWFFESAKLYCVARAGGACAAVLTEVKGASESEIETLLAEAPI